jgi:hypothetical protein
VGSNVTLSNSTGAATIASAGTGLSFSGVMAGNGAGLSNLSVANITAGTSGSGAIVLGNNAALLGAVLSNVDIGGSCDISVVGPARIGSNLVLSNATGAATIASAGTGLSFSGVMAGNGAGLSNLSVANIAAGTTGTGAVVLNTNPTLSVPNVSDSIRIGTGGGGGHIIGHAFDTSISSEGNLVLATDNNTNNNYSMSMIFGDGSSNGGDTGKFREYMRIRAGNVGIGTDSMQAMLHVAGTGRFNSNLIVLQTASLSNVSACNVAAATATLSNVALGGSCDISVVGPARFGSNISLSNSTGAATIASAGTGLSFSGVMAGNGAGLSNLSVANLTAGTTGSGSVVLNNGPTLTTATVNGDLTAAGGTFRLNNAGDGTRLFISRANESQVNSIIFSRAGTNAGAGEGEIGMTGAGGSMQFRVNGSLGVYTPRMTITSNGCVGIGTTTPQHPLHITFSSNNLSLLCTGDASFLSDARFKHDIVRIPDALNKVSSIGGYTYSRDCESRRMAGVLAQEVREVLPEVVHESAEGILSVSYPNLVALLIEAVKEARAMHEALRESHEALRGSHEALRESHEALRGRHDVDGGIPGTSTV